MNALTCAHLHSFMFSIHSFTAACGCGQGDYTNACNILIHSALLEDLMISSCSHVEVFPSHSSQIRKKDSCIVLEQHENPFTVTVILLLSQDPFIFMAAYFSCHKVKNTWVASSVCCLSALSMRQSFSLERDRDTDHALDQHSTLCRPSPHFITLEQPLRLVKCPLSRCSHEPLVLTLHLSTDPIIPMRLTPWRGLVSSLLLLF